MKSKEDIKPISYIKSHAADVLNQVNKTHRPLYVTQNGEAKAVLLDTESYEKMTDALAIMKIVSQGEKDVREGKVIRQEDFFSLMDKKLANKKKNDIK